jgi:protein SCO1/2
VTRQRRALLAGRVLALVGLLGGCGSGSVNAGSGAGATVSGHAAISGHAAAVAAQQHEMAQMPGMSETKAPAGGALFQPEPVVHGFRLNVPLPRPQFVLTDTGGQRYDFWARTRGRVTLLYFGYTSCPDQCPTTMAGVATALRQLPAGMRSKVTVVFVTIDPKHDTPAVLRERLGWYRADIVGLTGSQAAVEAAQRAARVTVSYPKPEKIKTNALSTAHGGGVLAYGLDDYAHLTYPAGTAVSDLVRDLPKLIRGNAH